MPNGCRSGVLTLALLVGQVVAPGAAAGTPASTTEAGEEFGGEYAALSSGQQRLIDDLFRRFSEALRREVSPEVGYNRARLSERTTFEAVTHALEDSPLSDAEGVALGTALDLIGSIEAIHGKVKGARGDQQFRIYCRLANRALALLERSREFDRKRDNTVFHKGYPLNFRQEGGYPSIQFSVTRDGRRADIDVDYRSSKFPNALFNGHLTAANSDVRAGNNHDRHDRRWEGLAQWWSGFFGLLFAGDSYRGEESQDSSLLPFLGRPRAGNATIDVAVYDFLSSWLVEKEPGLSMAYFSRRAWTCAELDALTAGEEVDYGVVPWRVLRAMEDMAEMVGPVQTLGEATVGVRLVDPDLRLVRQDHHAQFVLHGVPRWRAAALECASRLKLGEPPRRPGHGMPVPKIAHFTAVFYVKGPNRSGSTVATLWERERGDWKIISYEIEAVTDDDEGDLPDLAGPAETTAAAHVTADPGLVAATRDYLGKWLIEKDYDAALRYVAPRAFPCIDLQLAPGEPPAGRPEAQKARIRAGLESAGRLVGEIVDLAEVLGPAEPWGPDERIVDHEHGATYGLSSVPDWMGEEADCQRALDDVAPVGLEEREARYGKYYDLAFRFDTLAGETEVLRLGWTKLDGSWRIYEFGVLEP
jgi:hypothetical protein